MAKGKLKMKIQTLPRWLWLLPFILLFTLSACDEEDAPLLSTDTPIAVTVTLPGATAVTPTLPAGGRAFIESLEVMVLESFPVQVQATINGNLSDSCTSLADTNVQQQGNTFIIGITTNYDTQAACTEALVPFSKTVSLTVEGLSSGTYTVRAGGLSETFALNIVNEPIATPDLGSATLTVGINSARAGESVTLTGAGFPANAAIEIGIGPVESEYDIIASTQAGADGRFTTQVSVPTYVEAGERWVFVAEVNNANVLANPISIVANTQITPSPPSDVGVNEPVNGLIGRTYMYLIALEDGGQSGPQIGCNDSAIPVVIDIAPTVAPLTAAISRLLSLDEQYYGESGLYNAFYQSDLTLQGINIQNGEAIISLSGNLQLGGVCDDPRILAQLEYTALQYGTVDSVSILLNGQSLPSPISGRG
jgi:hypothetical protein